MILSFLIEIKQVCKWYRLKPINYTNIHSEFISIRISVDSYGNSMKFERIRITSDLML